MPQAVVRAKTSRQAFAMAQKVSRASETNKCLEIGPIHSTLGQIFAGSNSPLFNTSTASASRRFGNETRGPFRAMQVKGKVSTLA